VLSGALPGGEQLEKVGDNEYRAVMNVKVGPVQGRFEGKIELSDIVAPERYTMKVDGQGAPGFVAGEGQLELVEVEDGGTLLRYGGDVSVGGRIAGVGQRLVESTAKSVTRQGLTALDLMIQARLQPQAVAQPDKEVVPTHVEGAESTPPGSPEVSAPAGPRGPQAVGAAPVRTSTAAPAAQPSMAGMGVQVAKDVASDIASDYIPADKQERVLYFSLGVLAMLLFVLLVRLVQKD
jgi:carbon monoxide dehydrogenase subunit G